jgi:hypothetical protein
VANDNDDINSGMLFRVTQVMFGKLSKKSIVDGKSITEKLCTMADDDKINCGTLIRVI